MQSLDFVVSTPISDSTRVAKLEAMFDCPREEKQQRTWRGELPLDEREWQVGLIVGPSGAGKTLVARELFGDAVDIEMAWGKAAVIDDFAVEQSIDSIAKVCHAVGFNTIPAWMRPHGVLSNGEQFRVNLARRLLELPDPIVVDEFTSVVDRQVAKIGSHAVQKYIRRNSRRFVAITCHYDVIDWLQPDWTLEPATMAFAWRSVQPRPRVEVAIGRVPYDAWRIFAPYHYLTATLNKSAQCFGLMIDGALASFTAILHRPTNRSRVKGISRIVTLPDYQGMGLAFALADVVGAAYRATGCRLRNYPAHPSFIREHDRSPKWALIKRPGIYAKPKGRTSITTGKWGGRPCAVFEYVGPAMGDRVGAQSLITGVGPPASAIS